MLVGIISIATGIVLLIGLIIGYKYINSDFEKEKRNKDFLDE